MKKGDNYRTGRIVESECLPCAFSVGTTLSVAHGLALWEVVCRALHMSAPGHLPQYLSTSRVAHRDCFNGDLLSSVHLVCVREQLNSIECV